MCVLHTQYVCASQTHLCSSSWPEHRRELSLRAEVVRQLWTACVRLHRSDGHRLLEVAAGREGDVEQLVLWEGGEGEFSGNW